VSFILTLILGPIPAVVISQRDNNAWVTAVFAVIAIALLTLFIGGLVQKKWTLVTVSICIWFLIGFGVAVVAAI
jgi:hypothetical protein